MACENCDFCSKPFGHSQVPLNVKKTIVRRNAKSVCIRISFILADLFPARMVKVLSKICKNCVEYIAKFHYFKEDIQTRLWEEGLISMDDIPETSSEDDQADMPPEDSETKPMYFPPSTLKIVKVETISDQQGEVKVETTADQQEVATEDPLLNFPMIEPAKDLKDEEKKPVENIENLPCNANNDKDSEKKIDADVTNEPNDSLPMIESSKDSKDEEKKPVESTDNVENLPNNANDIKSPENPENLPNTANDIKSPITKKRRRRQKFPVADLIVRTRTRSSARASVDPPNSTTTDPVSSDRKDEKQEFIGEYIDFMTNGTDRNKDDSSYDDASDQNDDMYESCEEYRARKRRKTCQGETNSANDKLIKLCNNLQGEEKKRFEEAYEKSNNCNPKICSICSKMLTTSYGVRYHLFKRHFRPKETTQKMWISQKLNEGKIILDHTVKWKCLICDRICNSQPSLRYHLSQHTEHLGHESEGEKDMEIEK